MSKVTQLAKMSRKDFGEGPRHLAASLSGSRLRLVIDDSRVRDGEAFQRALGLSVQLIKNGIVRHIADERV